MPRPSHSSLSYENWNFWTQKKHFFI
jgi:hypothetical protein